MKIKTSRSLLFGIVFVLALVFAQPAQAHVGEPRLEISADRLNPGGIVDIRGVGFDYDELVTLYLERPGIVVQLGQIIADLEGTFVHTIVLPSDLPEGSYSIRGVTDHHDVISPILTVQGSAVFNEESGREEREALLAPVPTFAPGVVPGGVVQPTQVAVPVPERTSVSSLSPTLLLGLSVLLVLAVFFVFRRSAGANE